MTRQFRSRTPEGFLESVELGAMKGLVDVGCFGRRVSSSNMARANVRKVQWTTKFGRVLVLTCINHTIQSNSHDFEHNSEHSPHSYNMLQCETFHHEVVLPHLWSIFALFEFQTHQLLGELDNPADPRVTARWSATKWSAHPYGNQSIDWGYEVTISHNVLNVLNVL